MIAILFRCGHQQRVDPDKTMSPACVTCGETIIARALDAAAPRFTGHARGPLVETKALEPIAVSLATVALKLKPEGATDARP